MTTGTTNHVNNTLGASGKQGQLTIYPTTSNKGTVVWKCSDNAGNTQTTITNASMAASRILTIPDVGADSSFAFIGQATTITGTPTFSNNPVFTNGITMLAGSTDWLTVDTTISSAQILALNTTPITLVAAPGANLIAIPYYFYLYTAGGTAYTAASTFTVRYTNGSGTTMANFASTVLTNGGTVRTIAQTQCNSGNAAGSNGLLAVNAPLVLTISANPTVGNFGIKVRTKYRVVPSTF